jgi:ferritin-like metal-binding protein YciE
VEWDITQSKKLIKGGTFMAHNEYFLNRLDNAHAIKKDAVETYERQIDDAEGYPEIQQKMREHYEASRSHLDSIKHIIDQHGGSTSGIKGGLASVVGSLTGVLTTRAEDKVLQDLIYSYAFESLEVAAFHSLIISAEEIGDHETAQTLESIMNEDKDMRDWTSGQIEPVTRDFTQKKIHAEHDEIDDDVIDTDNW